MPATTLYVTATRTGTYQETTTVKIPFGDGVDIEQYVKGIRNGDDVLLFDDAKWYRDDNGYGSDKSNFKIERIVAEVEY